jgi:glycosidase
MRSTTTTTLALTLAATGALAHNPFATQPKADEVFYHIMPIAWRDGPDPDSTDPNRFGDFRGMRDGLDYLEDLGITAMWMNPIFPSPAYHGYQHGRADQVNPWFGTESQFIDFVEDAHGRDIEVYLDFVVYGISHNSPWYTGAFGNPGSTFDDWLAFTNGSNTQYQGYTFNTWNSDFVGFIHWDLRTPQATDLVTSWALKWMDPNNDGDFSDGVDGYRLDHVWVNYGSGPDGWGYNLDDFWAHWHTELRALNPDVFTFCEQHDWGSHGREFLPQFDAAMTKPFEFAARDSLRNENAGSIRFQMDETVNLYRTGAHEGTFVAIIGDHDVDRLASSIGADTPGTMGRAHVAAHVLMLQPFPPIIYYGDEIAMRGFKGSFDNTDAVDIPMREPFKWNAVEGAPMSRYQRENTPATFNQYSSDHDGRSVEEQLGQGGVVDTYKAMIALRTDNVALRRGEFTTVNAAHDSIWSFARIYEQGDAPIPDPGQALVCAINLSGSSVTTTLDLRDFVPDGADMSATDISVSGASLPNVTSANAGSYPVTIPAYSSLVIESGFERPPPPPEPPVTIDGQFDEEYTTLVSASAGAIHATIEGDILYLATDPAMDGRDRFLLLALEPGPMSDAMWAKAGQVAQFDAFMGNENDNNWAGWFDAAQPQGPVSGEVLEGAIDLRAQFGFLPDQIHVASVAYFTNDGDPLDPALQIPQGNGDGDVQANEYLAIDLVELAAQSDCAPDLNGDGDLDFFDVSALLNGTVDYNDDGSFDFFDISAFLQDLSTGCP